MSYWKPDSWREMIGGTCVVLVVGCLSVGLFIAGVHSVFNPAPQQSPIEESRVKFIEQCGGHIDYTNREHIGNNGIAKAVGDNPDEWTCDSVNVGTKDSKEDK